MKRSLPALTLQICLLVCILGIFVLAGCAGASTGSPTPVPSFTPSPEGSPAALETGAPSTDSPLPPTELAATPPVLKLRIWIPPQFDLASEEPAGQILQQRLEEFAAQRPGVEIQVRVKALSGPGGMLDSLSTTSAAAPLALPDLVALPRDLLETAALKGLLRPIDDLTDALDDRDWYDYARQLSRLQNSTFGLPFAGDALVLVYRSGAEIFNLQDAALPVDWPTVLEMRSPLVFPAADPLALFTLAQYQATGGEISDEEGRPYLDAERLGVVLDFYMQAEQSGLMPYWLTQFQSDEQVWQAFIEQRSDMVVAWSSHYLTTVYSATNTVSDLAFAPLPTPDGSAFTLATGWVWALASSQPDQRILSLELAEFLCQAEFLARWTEALGYLPPRANALNGWANAQFQPLLDQTALTARLYPSSDLSTPLGAALQNAVIQVLKQQTDPASAAQAAAAELSEP